MSKLIPIQYHNKNYPSGIVPKINEVAGHFDIKSIKTSELFSLHTEYSFTARKFEHDTIKNFPVLMQSKKGIPQLWHDKEWAIQFAEYIICMCEDNTPYIIEIHPPFSDYSKLSSFLELYKEFENIIKDKYPNVKILIENRAGSRYSGGKFILSNIGQLLELSRLLDSNNISLKITLDIPQLFTAHNICPKTINEIPTLFEELKAMRHNISGIHLWGKRISENGRKVAHVGDLNSYFNGNSNYKILFLNSMFNCFSDDIKRYFVPEVNSSSEDLISIVNDLLEVGFIFV